jgi:hypothetical protein
MRRGLLSACARVPKPDQKRILETIVSELLGGSRPRVCAVGFGLVVVLLRWWYEVFS